MKMLKKAAIGAVDLPLDLLLNTVDRVLANARYALEWVPGALANQYGVTKLHLQWIASPERGSWLVLPIEPHGTLIAKSLVRELQRPLVYHIANWYSGGRQGDLGAVSYEMQTDGEKRPLPTGLETKDLDEIADTGDSDSAEGRIQILIRHMIGISDGPHTSQYSFSIYEVAEVDDEGTGPETGGEVSEGKLNNTLSLLRKPDARAMLRREGPNSYLVEIEGAESWRTNIYMNHCTADALVSAARSEELSLLANPSVKGAKLSFT